MSRIKLERILAQLIINIQYGGTVSFNHNTGSGILRIVFFPACLGFVRYAAVGGMNCFTHRTVAGHRVIVDIRGFGSRIVILFKHVYDGIINSITVPLGKKSGIPIHRYRGTRRLCAVFIRIPAGECIARTGRHCAGHSLLGTIRYRSAAHIAAAVGFIGELEVLAGVLDLQLLFLLPIHACRFNRVAVRAFQIGVPIIFDGGRDIRALHAFHIRYPLNFGITGTRQILEQINNVIQSREFHILDAYRAGVVLPVIIGEAARKIRQRHSLRGCCRIINRRAGNIVCLSLRRGRRIKRVRKLLLFPFYDRGFKNMLTAIIRQVIVLDANGVYFHGLEYGDDRHIAADNRFCRNLFTRIFIDPLIKRFSGNERFFGHGADGLTFRTEILVQAFVFGRATVFLLHNEGNSKFRHKIGVDIEVASDFLAAYILGLPDKPALELLAFHRRVFGQNQRIAGIILRGGVNGVFIQHKVYGEDILFIGRFYGSILIHLGSGGKFCIFTVHPISPISFFRRNFRQAGYRVKGIVCNNDRVSHRRCAIFFHESDGVGDILILRRHLHIRGNHSLRVNHSISTFYHPPAALALPVFRFGQQIANRMAFFNLYDFFDLTIAVKESNRPIDGFVGSVYGHIAGYDRSGRNFAGILIHPLAVGIAFFFGHFGQLITNGGVRVQLDGILRLTVHLESDGKLLDEPGIEGNGISFRRGQIVRKFNRVAAFRQSPAIKAVSRFGRRARGFVRIGSVNVFFRKIHAVSRVEVNIDHLILQFAQHRQLQTRRSFDPRFFCSAGCGVRQRTERARVENHQQHQQPCCKFSGSVCHRTNPLFLIVQWKRSDKYPLFVIRRGMPQTVFF